MKHSFEKLILLIILSFFSNVSAKTDYLSINGFASNQVCVKEILSMQNAIAYIGLSNYHPYANATYSVIFRNENGQCKIKTFSSKQLDENKNFKNLNCKLNKDEIIEYSLNDSDANTILKVLKEQIKLAEKKGINDGSKVESLEVAEIGLKDGDEWIFAGQKYSRPLNYAKRKQNPHLNSLEEKYSLNRYSVAKKLLNLFYSPNKKWLERTIKSLNCDYKILAEESLNDTLIKFDLERSRLYWGLIDFNNDKTTSTFLFSPLNKKCYCKVVTLRNVLNLKLSSNKDSQTTDVDIIASIKRNFDKPGTAFFASSYNFKESDEFIYLYESNILGVSDVSTEFLSIFQSKVSGDFEKTISKIEPKEEIIYAQSSFDKDSLFEKLFLSTLENKILKQIDSKINPPISRFKGQKNDEFSEAFGIATFRDADMIDFWSVHINSGNTAILTFEDSDNVEKNAVSLSLNFDKTTRIYSNVNFSVSDKSSTVFYDKNSEKIDTLICKFNKKIIKDDITIIECFKDKSKGLTKVIFSGKINP